MRLYRRFIYFRHSLITPVLGWLFAADNAGSLPCTCRAWATKQSRYLVGASASGIGKNNRQNPGAGHVVRLGAVEAVTSDTEIQAAHELAWLHTHSLVPKSFPL
jgi:hypothetical protein